MSLFLLIESRVALASLGAVCKPKHAIKWKEAYMLEKITRFDKPRYLMFIVPFFVLIVGLGCENQHYDERLQIRLQQLDSDLKDRWSTSGVVVLEITPNGPADKARLERGELISYVIAEYPIRSTSDFNSAIKSGLDEDNNFILYLKDKPPLRIALRRRGDKVGLDVEGSGTVRVKQIQLGTPAANTDIQVGDIVEKIVDERKIYSLDDYKETLGKLSKQQVTFRTSELIGVKIAAVNALGDLGDARAIEPLVDIFRNSTELSLRKASISSLQRLVELSVLNQLFQQFQSADVNELPADSLQAQQLESAAILGLLTVDRNENTATLKAPFGTQFRHRSEVIYQKINEGQLAGLAQEYIQIEVEPDQEIRRACLAILGMLKPVSAIDALVAVLENPAEIPGIRFQAGVALRQIGEPAVDALIAAFESEDTSTKDIAASALGGIGGIKARDRLIKALENTSEPAIQLTLVDAIAKIGDAPSMQALERQRQQYQGDDDSGIRIFLDEVFKNLTQKSM
jgi:HEAT repeat protein